MKNRDALWQGLYRNFIVVILTFALIYLADRQLSTQVGAFFIIITAIAADLIVIGVKRIYKKGLFWITLSVIVLLTLIISDFFGWPPQRIIIEFRSWLIDGMDWFGQYYSGAGQSPDGNLTEYRRGFILVSASVSVLVSTIIFYLLSINKITRMATAGLLTAGLVIFTVFNRNVNKLSLVCVLVYICASVIELCSAQLNRRRTDQHKSTVVFMLPVCILLALTAIVFPSDSEPIKWEFARSFIQSVSDKVQYTTEAIMIKFGGMPSNFTLSFTGLDTDVNKSASTYTSDKPVMYITTNGRTYSKTYLRGNISSEYEDGTWSNDSCTIKSPAEQDYERYEILYSALRTGFTPDANEDVYHRTSINVEYDSIITKSLLYNGLCYNISTDLDYIANGSIINFKKIQHSGAKYTLNYYETNWGSENLADFIRSLDDFSYETDDTDWNALDYDNIIFNALTVNENDPDTALWDKNMVENLAKRAQEIETCYTKLPGDLSDDVYKLARDITSGCETKYDKLLAIESYFSDYTYTLTPEMAPDGEDFLDWFLFKSREGYCTYFATAATILARCAGLPARFVQGMVISDTLDSREALSLNNRAKHAWCEVYIEGYGWITLEATPGYSTGRDTEWKRKTLTSGGERPDVPDPFALEEEQQNQIENWTPPETEDDTELLARIEAEKAARRAFWLRASYITAAGIALCMVIAYALWSREKARRYTKADNNGKVRIIAEKIMHDLSSAGYKRPQDETLMEFTNRVGHGFDYSTMSLRGAMNLFAKFRYSSAKATRAEVLMIYRYERELRKNIRNNLRFIHKLIFDINGRRI